MEVVPTPALTIMLAIPFLVTVFALRFILFKPLVEYLLERDRASADARAEAMKLETAASHRLDEVEKRLAGAREQAMAVRTEARKKAADQEAGILQAARAEAEARVSSAIATITSERQIASMSLRDTASALSGDIASRILGRVVR
jgi:F-type H+-transporting ATPase subunit b